MQLLGGSGCVGKMGSLINGVSMSSDAKRIYAGLAMYQGKDGNAFPTQETLSNELNIPLRNVIREIGKLKKLGWIDARDKHGRSATYYFRWNDTLATVTRIQNGEDWKPCCDEKRMTKDYKKKGILIKAGELVDVCILQRIYRELQNAGQPASPTRSATQADQGRLTVLSGQSTSRTSSATQSDIRGSGSEVQEVGSDNRFRQGVQQPAPTAPGSQSADVESSSSQPAGPEQPADKNVSLRETPAAASKVLRFTPDTDAAFVASEKAVPDQEVKQARALVLMVYRNEFLHKYEHQSSDPTPKELAILDATMKGILEWELPEKYIKWFHIYLKERVEKGDTDILSACYGWHEWMETRGSKNTGQK